MHTVQSICLGGHGHARAQCQGLPASPTEGQDKVTHQPAGQDACGIDN